MSKFKFEFAGLIEHLSPDEIEELYSRYIGGEKNSILVDEYKISISPNNLISVFPPRLLPDKVCPYCHLNMHQSRESKSQSRFDKNPEECFTCGHRVYPDSNNRRMICACAGCKAKRIEEKNLSDHASREVIKERYDVGNEKVIPYSELKFTDKIIIITLFWMQMDDSLEHIQSLATFNKLKDFTPTDDMSLCFLNMMYEKRVLIVDPESDLEAFYGECLDSFHIDRVQWILNVSTCDSDRSSLDEIYKLIYCELTGEVQREWIGEIYDLLFGIAREEIVSYILLRSDELGVVFSCKNKAREIINGLLENFSVSEIYYFARKSVENAHLFYHSGYAKGKKHAGNTIPSKMLDLGDRAYKEGWNTYKYKRDYRLARSEISEVFYDFFLGDVDVGFNKSPGSYWKDELCSSLFSKMNVSSEIECEECGSKDFERIIEGSNLELVCRNCGVLRWSMSEGNVVIN